MPTITYLEIAELVGTDKQKEHARNNKWINGGSMKSFMDRASCYYTNLRKDESGGRKVKKFTYDEAIPEEEGNRRLEELKIKNKTFDRNTKEIKTLKIERKESIEKIDFETRSDVGLKELITSTIFKYLSDDTAQQKLDEKVENLVFTENGIGMSKTSWMKALGLKNRVIVEASRDYEKSKRLHALMGIHNKDVSEHILMEVLKQEEEYGKNRFESVLKGLIKDEVITSYSAMHAVFTNGDFRKLSISESNQIDSLKIEAMHIINNSHSKPYELSVLEGGYAATSVILNAQKHFRKELNSLMLKNMNIKYTINLLFIESPLKFEIAPTVSDLEKMIKKELLKHRTACAKRRSTKISPTEQKHYDIKDSRPDFSRSEEIFIAVAESKIEGTYLDEYVKVLKFIWSDYSVEALQEMTNTEEYMKDGKVMSEVIIETNVQVQVENHKAEVLNELQFEVDSHYVFGDLMNEDAMCGTEVEKEEEYATKAIEVGRKLYTVEIKDAGPFDNAIEYRLERGYVSERTRRFVPIMVEKQKENKKDQQ